MSGSDRSGHGVCLAVWVALTLVAAELVARAPAASPLSAGFEPPAPGTYRLERIMGAPDGVVLDVDGRSQQLSRWTRGRVTLLSFVYTSCNDPLGCPLAYAVFLAVAGEIEKNAGLADKVRFVTLSFDPQHDSPDVMRRYGDRARQGRPVEWRFLTTPSAADLRPLLEGFGQDVQVAARSPDGESTRELSHVMKVFLIDASGMIREIYSSAYLQVPVVLNDIQTLVLEDVGAVAHAKQ